MKRSLTFIIAIGFTLLLCTAQTVDWKKDQDVLDGIEAKLDAFRARKIKECKQKALKEAGVKVDSLLKQSTGQLKKDSIRKPFRPTRPNAPGFEVALDSTPIVPIIK